MPKATVTNFQKGQRVKLTRVRHERYRGLEGTVTRVFTTKKVVVVQVGPNDVYHADPVNIDLVTQSN